MAGEWIPIILFICILGIVAVSLHFASKREYFRQETIRAAIEKGQELTEEVVMSLTPNKPKNTALYIGLPTVGLAVALLIFGIGTGETEAAWASVFPLFLGAGVIISWYIDKK